MPVQVSANVVDAVRLERVSLPDAGLVPLQPPLAVQKVAFVLDQVSVVVPPAATAVALAARLTVGAAKPSLGAAESPSPQAPSQTTRGSERNDPMRRRKKRAVVVIGSIRIAGT
ncbi:MAG: hypothetical protein ACK4V1_05120 [Burkholderiaceae bacterium]